MPRSIQVSGIKGMSNLPRASGKLLDDARLLTPNLILNADPIGGGLVQRRKGFSRVASLVNPHSIWAESVMLCVADNDPATLFRLEGSQAIPLAQVPGPRMPLAYAEIDNLVYLGNPFWRAVYDIHQDLLRSWGLPLPPCPEIELVPGDFPPGTYGLCYTTFDGTRIGGNGTIVKFAWGHETRGIRLKNLPDDALCWITHANGGNLFLAALEGDQIAGVSPTIKKLPSFGVCPPPGMRDFIHAFGRIWGAVGKEVYYTDSFHYERFRPGNYLPVGKEVVLLAAVNEGLFINSLTDTWFVAGSDPGKMKLNRIGDGAIPGTRVMAQVEGGGYEISRNLSQLPSPVWMSKTGLVVGTQTGHIVRLSESKVKIVPRTRGASFAWLRDGVPQIISSVTGSPTVAESNTPELLEVSRNAGKLIV